MAASSRSGSSQRTHRSAAPAGERRLEILAVARRGVVVEQLLQCRTAETGADQRGGGDGDRAARQQDEPRQCQGCHVFDLVAEAGGHDRSFGAARLAGGGKRIVRGQHREIARGEPGRQQARNGAVEMAAIGERGDRLANDRERCRGLDHADPLFVPASVRARLGSCSPPAHATVKRGPLSAASHRCRCPLANDLAPMTEPPRPDAGGPAFAGSPVMIQYHEIKRANPGCLLFFRMGDFFELFFDDAVAAAGALDIALTKRGRHDGADIPMCGVPVHTAETYLARLIRAGFKVAICDQIEDAAEARRRGVKGPVRRAVVRVVTAGTLTEEGLLDARRHNYLVGLAEAGGEIGLAWLDLSTGAFALAPSSEPALPGDLARLAPGEILLPERMLTRPPLYELLAEWKPVLTPLPNPRFESGMARRRLEEFYGVKALDGFGNFGRAEIAAAGALVDYVGLTQQGRAPYLEPPRRVMPGSVMQIDAATRRNLELVANAAGERRGSLLATIDRTVTAAGARLLADHLAAPLTAAGGDRRPPRCGRIFQPLRRSAHGAARAPAPLPGPRARLDPVEPRPRRPARPGGIAPVPRRDRVVAPHVGRAGPGAAARASRRGPLRARPAWRAGRSARPGAGRRIAALRPRRRLYRRRLFGRARRVAPAARREPPHDRGTPGALRRRDRDRRPQDPPQQCDRLLRRGIGRATPASSGRSSSTARPWPAPSATRRPSWPISKPGSRRPPNARWRWSCTSTTTSSARSWPGAPRSPGRPRHWPRSISRRRWPNARPRAAGCGPRSKQEPRSRSAADAIRWSRRVSPPRAMAAALSPTTASWPRSGSGSSPAPTWPARARFCGRTR